MSETGWSSDEEWTKIVSSFVDGTDGNATETSSEINRERSDAPLNEVSQFEPDAEVTCSESVVLYTHQDVKGNNNDRTEATEVNSHHHIGSQGDVNRQESTEVNQEQDAGNQGAVNSQESREVKKTARRW